MLKQIIKFISLILILTATTQSTNSSFSDGLILGGNYFSIGYWLTPPTEGEVVINEVMWMGSTAAASDQWLELRNTTNRTIDISGCNLANVEAGNQILTIEDGKSIEPNGYFLVAKKEPGATALADGVVIDQVDHNLSFHQDYSKNGQITLTCDGTLIDQTPEPEGKNWPFGTDQSGSSKLKQSMERNDNVSGWHTCISKDCTLSDYWTQSGNYGTPGAANSSESAPAYISAITDLTLTLDSTKHFATFNITGPGLPLFNKAEFTFAYIDDGVDQKIEGKVRIPHNATSLTHEIELGTCTSDEVCNYPVSVTDIAIEVILQGSAIDRQLSAAF